MKFWSKKVISQQALKGIQELLESGAFLEEQLDELTQLLNVLMGKWNRWTRLHAIPMNKEFAEKLKNFYNVADTW